MAVEREIGMGMKLQKEVFWWVGGGVGLQGSRQAGVGSKERWARQKGKKNVFQSYHPIYIIPKDTDIGIMIHIWMLAQINLARLLLKGNDYNSQYYMMQINPSTWNDTSMLI